MGQDRTVRFRAGHVPAWDAIKQRLFRVGEPGTLRMIDGLPAFPDETPEPGWNEVRVAAGGPKLTVRRGSDSLACVVWGNADAALLASWNNFVWACAAAGEGVVLTETGAMSADEFARFAGVRPA